jgi:hypothetical protein
MVQGAISQVETVGASRDCSYSFFMSLCEGYAKFDLSEKRRDEPKMVCGAFTL